MNGFVITLLTGFVFLGLAATFYIFSGSAPGDGGPNLVPMLGMWISAAAAVLAWLVAFAIRPNRR